MAGAEPEAAERVRGAVRAGAGRARAHALQGAQLRARVPAAQAGRARRRYKHYTLTLHSLYSLYIHYTPFTFTTHPLYSLYIHFTFFTFTLLSLHSLYSLYIYYSLL